MSIGRTIRRWARRMKRHVRITPYEVRLEAVRKAVRVGRQPAAPNSWVVAALVVTLWVAAAVYLVWWVLLEDLV